MSKNKHPNWKFELQRDTFFLTAISKNLLFPKIKHCNFMEHKLLSLFPNRDLTFEGHSCSAVLFSTLLPALTTLFSTHTGPALQHLTR